MCETRFDIQKIEGDFYNVESPENNVSYCQMWCMEVML